ncbi:MAG: glucose-6-phosphate isomerase family protein [Candidatus Micrarchaeota archaeon]
MSATPLNTQPLNLALRGADVFMNGRKLSWEARRLGDMRAVLYDSNFLSSADKKTSLYFMYRDLSPDARKFDVRYDITVLLPLKLGAEFNKTLGHYHSVARAGLSYTEIYEVLSGRAHYLLQKLEGGKVADAVMLDAKKGDVVLIPPNYGHVTINAGAEPLAMANLVSSKLKSLYEPYEKMRGAAYFELADGRIVKNENYGTTLPELKTLPAPKRKLAAANILDAFLRNPRAFEFLNDPTKFISP